MSDQIRVVMKFQNNVTGETREVFRMYEKPLEDIWQYITVQKNKGLNRRKKTDRENMIFGYYYGKTITGKKYGGMHIINNQHVRPQDIEYFKTSYYTKEYYNQLESNIERI